MHIKELTLQQFESFVSAHPLGNHYQSGSYALLMNKNGYECKFIGYVDEKEKIHAASLILIKNLNTFFKYGYAPRGFILDYFNQSLLKNFTEALISYYKKKRLVFIKLNPEIAACEIDSKTFQKRYNQNIEIKSILVDCGYKKLKDNLYFESILPRYNGIVSLKDFSMRTLEKNTRNKVKRAREKGLNFELADPANIDILNNFIMKKKDMATDYQKFYQVFSDTKNIDYFLVSIDAHLFLENAKNAYEKELKNNSEYAKILSEEKSERNCNLKMNSDKRLLAYKNDIAEAKKMESENSKIYIAGALVVKYRNRISIVCSGYNTNYKSFNPNYFLHYEILKFYEKHYDFADLNGMTGDFSSKNPYKGLNNFKLGYHPKVYEFIGEYDLPIFPFVYQRMLKSGKLAKVFNKKYSKIK